MRPKILTTANFVYRKKSNMATCGQCKSNYHKMQQSFTTKTKATLYKNLGGYFGVRRRIQQSSSDVH